MKTLDLLIREHDDRLERINNTHNTVNDWVSGLVLVVCIWLYFAFPF